LDLVATKTRAHYGSYELAGLYPALWKNRGESNNNSLLRLFRNPLLWPKLAVYSVVTIAAKRRARKRIRTGGVKWERDDTSRISAKPATIRDATHTPSAVIGHSVKNA
jgi:hypothetical protein